MGDGAAPSCPPLLSPQHLTAPVAVTAHVKSLPAEIIATPLVKPTTSCGVPVLLNEPSCCLSLAPQHLTPAAEVSAQL